MEVANCPVCDVPLNEIDCYDDVFDFHEITRLCVGECPCCEKEYQYKEVFYFHHVEVNETPED
jgi:hypothetical protein